MGRRCALLAHLMTFTDCAVAGHEETFKMAEQMHGCPIGGVWAPGAGNQ